MNALNQSDPLESLVSSDAKIVDRKKLTELLQSFIIIDRDSKELSFLDSFEKIGNNIGKIEILLAASKARALVFNEPEGLFPADIINLAIMPEGSVKTSLKKLSDSHKIKKNKEGRYNIPSYRISELLKTYTKN
jgi:hypothetical protein